MSVIMMDNLAEDGVRTVLEFDEGFYRVTCSLGDEELSENYKAQIQPVMGPDIVDVKHANKVAEKLAARLLKG